MGVVTGTCTVSLSFSDFVTAGYVNGETLTALLAAPGTPGATLSYTYGQGALQVDAIAYLPVFLNQGIKQTIDLSRLTGLGGEAVNFFRVREVVGFNPGGYDVQCYQGSPNGWAFAPDSSAPLYARANNGHFRISDPNSVGVGIGNVVTITSKTIVLDPGQGGPVTVYLLLAGVLAQAYLSPLSLAPRGMLRRAAPARPGRLRVLSPVGAS